MRLTNDAREAWFGRDIGFRHGTVMDAAHGVVTVDFDGIAKRFYFTPEKLELVDAQKV